MSSKKTWFCPHCSAENNDAFCGKCGAPKPNSTNHSNKLKYIMIIIIIVLAVILAGLVFSFSKSTSSDTTSQPTTSQTTSANEVNSSSETITDDKQTSDSETTVANENNAQTNNAQADKNKIDKVVITRDSLVGNWKSSDGNVLSIDNANFGMASYTIDEFSTTENGAQIKISLNGGRSVDIITFSNNDATRFTLKNLSTGTSNTYVRQ